MQYLVPVLKCILPYILKAADKYLPEVLECMIEKLKEKKEVIKMGASLKVIVKTSLGLALSGATVSYKIGSSSQSGTTANDGSYNVSDLPAETYIVTASKNGYTSGIGQVTIADGYSAELEIVLAAEVITKTVSEATAAATDTATKITTEIAEAANGDDTLSTAWSTIKSEIEAGISSIESLIDSLTLEKEVVTAFTDEVNSVQTNINSRIDKYQKLVLDARKNTDFWGAVALDFKWLAIEVSQAAISSEIAKLKTKLTAKIAELTAKS
jgi:hypothetical protein